MKWFEKKNEWFELFEKHTQCVDFWLNLFWNKASMRWMFLFEDGLLEHFGVCFCFLCLFCVWLSWSDPRVFVCFVCQKSVCVLCFFFCSLINNTKGWLWICWRQTSCFQLRSLRRDTFAHGDMCARRPGGGVLPAKMKMKERLDFK